MTFLDKLRKSVTTTVPPEQREGAIGNCELCFEEFERTIDFDSTCSNCMDMLVSGDPDVNYHDLDHELHHLEESILDVKQAKRDYDNTPRGERDASWLEASEASLLTCKKSVVLSLRRIREFNIDIADLEAKTKRLLGADYIPPSGQPEPEPEEPAVVSHTVQEKMKHDPEAKVSHDENGSGERLKAVLNSTRLYGVYIIVKADQRCKIPPGLRVLYVGESGRGEGTIDDRLKAHRHKLWKDGKPYFRPDEGEMVFRIAAKDDRRRHNIEAALIHHYDPERNGKRENLTKDVEFVVEFDLKKMRDEVSGIDTEEQ